MKDYEKKFYDYQTRARGLLTKDSLRERFCRSAGWYARRLRKFLPVELRAACVDLPCGYGNFLFFLRSLGYENITGYDADKEQVRLARLLDLPAHEGNAFEVMDGKKNEFDVISSLDFLEHIEKDEAIRFVESCLQALKPGGLLLIRTCCADGIMGAHDVFNDITHKWGMTCSVLQHLLEMTGFTKVEILDERPQAYNFVNSVRAAVFPVARCIMSGLLFCLGLMPPRIWSSSMWGVGYKPESS